ncbi:MAG: RimK family alpha-L-glutamate ligase [Candidatus Cloacimonadaceae bacterium]
MEEKKQKIQEADLMVGIVRNELPDSANDWISACENRNIKYQVIDLSASDWFEQVTSQKWDFLLLYPSGSFERYKIMYDERLHIICNELHIETYPGYNECIIYENKKMLSYFLQSRKIPHPSTRVFYNYEETKEYVNKTSFPIVAKTSIGASGSGVKIIRKQSEALSYLKQAFKGRGIKRRFGPNRVMGNPRKWFIKAVNSPAYFFRKIKQYLEINRNYQYGYVILQEYIRHDFEWRIVKIGDSFFAHKKIRIKDKASGAKVKSFGMPDIKVMDFVEDICKKNNLNFVCMDIFESERGYLVNEIQCIFGIPYGYLMKVGEEVGRIRKINGEWKFEAGDFTTNHCCDLRLSYILQMHEQKIANGNL